MIFCIYLWAVLSSREPGNQCTVCFPWAVVLKFKLAWFLFCCVCNWSMWTGGFMGAWLCTAPARNAGKNPSVTLLGSCPSRTRNMSINRKAGGQRAWKEPWQLLPVPWSGESWLPGALWGLQLDAHSVNSPRITTTQQTSAASVCLVHQETGLFWA